MITPTANRVFWPGPGAHSAVKLWNKDWVYVSDEVYGTITAAGHGCPWGWTRFIDIADPTRPVVREDFRLPENQPAICTVFNPPAAHLVLGAQPDADPEHRVQHLALGRLPGDGRQRPDERHAAGRVQAAGGSRTAPGGIQLLVGAEDPRLSSDDPTRGPPDVKVVMWSYPVIQDGLIYVVDLRNGLYILKYNGPHEDEVNQTKFLEGNSNQGDALCIEPVPGRDERVLRHPARRERGRHRAGDAVADARRPGDVRRVHAGHHRGTTPRRRPRT